MSQLAPVRAGIIGTGTISDVYFRAAQSFEVLDIVACADLFPDRARAKADEHGIAKAYSTDELLADPEIELVINLTIPKAHAEVGLAALRAGKHVYSEKPLALTRENGRALLALARDTGLLVGCAPDTFLGGGLQTCRKLIDDGVIGEPIGATAFMMSHGHESWHSDPAFYYDFGGGPMFDMGPYYLTALTSLIGPMRRVTGSARITFPERTITSQPRFGTTVKVHVPTHVAAVIDFHTGAVGTILTTFDVWESRLPYMEVYGTEGSMSVPNPNTFGGPVLVRGAQDTEWREVPLTHPYIGESRGLGVADMAYAVRTGRPYRATGELAYHVLDTMVAFHDASDQSRHIELQSTCDRPAPLPTGLAEGSLDS